MVQAIIMAGGEGSRLRPLTCDRPKPMVPVLNRPVMEYAVELIKRHGIYDIGVTLQYMPQEITDYFRDGSDHGINMQYFIEESPLGTAGSVKNAAGFLKETFVVVSGDALTDFDLSEAIKFHRAKGAIATLVLTPVEVPLEYGVVITESGGQIRQFLEKPGWGEVFSDTVNTGIYILEPEVLDYIPQSQKFDFSKDLFPLLLKGNKPLFGVSLRGYWCDIGNLRQYREAHYDAMEGRVKIDLKGDPGEEGIYKGRNCIIDPSAVINGPVFIGNNCFVGKNTVVGPHVVLGDNCRVEESASLKRTIVWNGSFIGKQAEIRGAVICSGVTLNDRAAVFEGAVIGDGTVVEENARVRPDIKIWPYKVVEKGATLDGHLIWGPRTCRNLFGYDGVSGKVNTNLIPECAAKLGAVYGTAVGPGVSVLVSSDQHRSSQMIKSAVQSGLLSVGISVMDGGEMVTPVHRNAVRALGAKGGVHIKSSSRDPEVLHINLFSETGCIISRDIERKIENLFEREDFRRRAKQEVGNQTYVPGLTESYIQNLIDLTDADRVRDRRFRIMADYPADSLHYLIPSVFNGLGCELISGSVQTGPDSFEMSTLARDIAGEIPKLHADMGIILDSNAEHVILIDEAGNVIDEDHFMALMALIILETSPRPVVAVPVSGSGAVDAIAEARQGRVIRTKTSPFSFLNEVLKPEIAMAQGRFNQAVISFDALSTVVRIIDYMAAQRMSLAEITQQIPEFHMVKKQTECPWTTKGRVMRQLIEETADRRVELLDGVKVYHENGWALVLPDPGEPQYHVYSEGDSYEFADELADFYINRINRLKDDST